jgi:hypothetical protein
MKIYYYLLKEYYLIKNDELTLIYSEKINELIKHRY